MKILLKITLVFFVLNAFQSCSKDDTPEPEPIAQPEPEPENNPPEISAQSFSTVENIADNIAIGTVEASDPDGDALTFSISTNDGALFEISETGTLSLDDLQSLDFETAQSHTITVTVNDGTASTEATVIITVTDVDDTSFVTTWETTGSNETVSISTRADGFTYDYTIDWGDGTIQSGRTENASHIYATAGTYTVSISGTFPAIILANNRNSHEQLRTVEQWGNIQWLTMENAFEEVEILAINATDTPDLSQVTSMRHMFSFIGNLSGNLNSWDVSNVTTMESLFLDCQFNQNIGDWDVSNVTNMEEIFHRSLFNQDIGNWDVSNVTNMVRMFESSPFDQDISRWDVGNATSMAGMFAISPFNQDIGGWDTSNVTHMGFMFSLASAFNQDISGWDTSKVTQMSIMFANSPFNQDIGSWDTSKVVNMGFMFHNSPFNQDISGWDTGNVTRVRRMFANSLFNQDISTWNVDKVTDCVEFADGALLTAPNSPNFTNCTP